MYAKLILLALLCCVDGQAGMNIITCGIIYCECGLYERPVLEIQRYLAEDVDTGKQECLPYPIDACEFHSCGFIAISGIPVEYLTALIINPAFFIPPVYPQKPTLPMAPLMTRRRFPRQQPECYMPKVYNRMTVYCEMWTHYNICNVTCTRGYGLAGPNGTVESITVTCKTYENEGLWKPIKDFPICRPYLNCYPRLTEPGHIKCREPLNEPAWCEISCHKHNWYEAIPAQKYDCIDNTFGHNFPRCATLRTDVITISRPE